MEIPFEKTLANILRWRVNKNPDLIAHKFGDRETTYREFDSYANKISQGLISLDCHPDTRVAFLAKNSDYFFEFLYGTLKSRTVAVGVNWRLAPPEVSFIVNDSKSEVLFVGSEFFGLVEKIKDDLPHVKKIIAVGDVHEEWEGFVDWRDAQEDKDPLLETFSEDDVIQLYTSGTTGSPKGVQLTNANFSSANIMATYGYYRDTFKEQSVNLVCMPVFHVAGTNMGLAGYVFGCKSIIIPEVDPTLILQLVEKERIENTLFVPAVILFLIQHPEVESTDWSSLKTVVYGASPIAQDTLEKAIEIMDCEFWQVYGLTETNGAVTFLSPEDHDPSKEKLRSCGKPGHGTEIKVVDEEGKDLPVGEVGEIIIKSGNNMKGYWNRSEATKESIINDWFYSGDAGFFDEDGFLFIHDRVKDMIVSGGENIYPAEVENALMSHEYIVDAAVIGIPDDKWGEAVKGFVVLGEGANLEEVDIISYTRTQIAGYKCPKSINFVSELPRNPSGKILRRELRDPYWEGKERQVS